MLPREAFYFPSQAQSNVYNFAFVESVASSDKPSENTTDLLVAYYRPVGDPLTNKECFQLYRFSSDEREINTSVTSLDFVYLPSDSDIVCINALKDDLTEEYIVGIGFVTDQDQGFLNIYRSKCQEKLSDCYLRYSELSCVPLQLTHTYYISPTSSRLQWAFLLSRGRPSSATSTVSQNDLPIAVFAPLCDNIIDDKNPETAKRKDKLPPSPLKNELPNESIDNLYGELGPTAVQKFFPELDCLPRTTILFMNFVLPVSSRPIRLSAFGGQDGWFGAFKTDMKQCVVLQRLEFSHDSSITHLQLFNSGVSEKSGDSTAPEAMDLLVCSAFESAVVYSDVFGKNTIGQGNQFILPRSSEFDHVNCACVGDLNFDGIPEIVLGTFGQTLLFYQWKSNVEDSSSLDLPNRANGSYILVFQKTLLAPIHHLSPPLDLVGDGLLSFAVLTSRGLHIYRHSVDTVLEILHKRISREIEETDP